MNAYKKGIVSSSNVDQLSINSLWRLTLHLVKNEWLSKNFGGEKS